MLILWIAVEILLGIALAFIVGRHARVVGVLLALAGALPMVALLVYTLLVPPNRDMSSEGMLSTLILVLVTPTGLATLATGFFRES